MPSETHREMINEMTKCGLMTGLVCQAYFDFDIRASLAVTPSKRPLDTSPL